MQSIAQKDRKLRFESASNNL